MSLNILAMLTGSIKRLAHVNRYSSLPVSRRENVAEHTCFVSLFSLFIGKDLKASGVEVDFAKLLTASLMHDLDESLSGDFLRTVKYGVPGLKTLLDGASEGFLHRIEKQLGVDILQDWKTAKDASLEGGILAIADLLAVVSYVLEEFSGGNRHLLDLLPEVDSYLESLEELVPSQLWGYLQESRMLVQDYYSNHRDSTYPTLMRTEQT
jgi:5'-deoxynucleotidase YfbR-like HD superfamily hydrolase